MNHLCIIGTCNFPVESNYDVSTCRHLRLIVTSNNTIQYFITIIIYRLKRIKQMATAKFNLNEHPITAYTQF